VSPQVCRIDVEIGNVSDQVFKFPLISSRFSLTKLLGEMREKKGVAFCEAI
jgi:hypothetical protein